MEPGGIRALESPGLTKNINIDIRCLKQKEKACRAESSGLRETQQLPQGQKVGPVHTSIMHKIHLSASREVAGKWHLKGVTQCVIVVLLVSWVFATAPCSI